MVLEDVPQGMAVPVNGFSFEGPGVVARQWTLRGLAVCPYGQDKNTAVEFSAGQTPEVAVRYTETEQPPAVEAAPAAVDPAKANDTKPAEAQPAVEAAATEEQPAARGCARRSGEAGRKRPGWPGVPYRVRRPGRRLVRPRKDVRGMPDPVQPGQGRPRPAGQGEPAASHAACRQPRRAGAGELRRSRRDREHHQQRADREATAALGSSLAKFAANIKFQNQQPKSNP